MRRGAPSKLIKKIAPFALLMLLASCSEKIENAVYAHDQCHRLTLTDSNTGLSVLGAEDMAKLPSGDLLVTAYDRRSTTDNGTPPEGGIYIVPAKQLGEKEIKVPSLFDTLPGGLRPHGVDAVHLKNDFVKVAFINRSYEQKSDTTINAPTIYTFLLKGKTAFAPEKVAGSFCRANDLVLANLSEAAIAAKKPVYGNIDQSPLNPHNSLNFQARQWTTLDRHYCEGIAAHFENITGMKAGSVTAQPLRFADKIDAYPIFKSAEKLAFPNGIGIQFKDRPLGDNNFLVVAETRANQLRYFPKTDRRDIVKLDGNPDNLNVGKPGIIQVAVHPSLFKLALYRYGWASYAPSRIQKVTGTQVLTLFDDPSGRLYSAASIAVQTAGKLVLGSVGDEGLLVCNARQTS